MRRDATDTRCPLCNRHHTNDVICADCALFVARAAEHAPACGCADCDAHNRLAMLFAEHGADLSPFGLREVREALEELEASAGQCHGCDAIASTPAGLCEVCDADVREHLDGAVHYPADDAEGWCIAHGFDVGDSLCWID